MSVILNNVDRIVNSSGDAIDFAQGVGGGSSKKFVATGNIGQGQTVGLKADGTVEAVKVTSTPQTQYMGSPSTFASGMTNYIDSVFIPDLNKVVIVYQDESNSNYGTIVIGTISGNTINFGNEFTYQNYSSSEHCISYDSHNKKVVLFFKDQNGYGNAMVGEISGDSINFGSPVIYESGNASQPSAIFNPMDKNFVLLYRESGGSAYYAKIVICEISGNSINFGSKKNLASSPNGMSHGIDPKNGKYLFAYKGGDPRCRACWGQISGDSISTQSAFSEVSPNGSNPSVVFDPIQDRFVIFYQDSSTKEGKSVVAETSLNNPTIGGSYPVYGTAEIFDSGDVGYLSSVFDQNLKKVVVFYSEATSQKGMSAIGTISSGNSIAFETPVEFNNSSTYYISSVFDSTRSNTLIFFNIWNLNKLGSSIVYTPAGTAVDYNASSWLGVADEAIASGDSGKINLIGSVDSHQTGLTTGSTYYVNYDGTLTDTPNEGVENGTYGKIGKALSSTSLLLSK